MLSGIIHLALKYRGLVILGALVIGAIGVVALQNLDIDAFPDTTPAQVQVNTVAPALGPVEVEQQITMPVEQALSGMPHLEELRSISKFGISQVVVTFRGGTDIYFARNQINERLASVSLPPGIARPRLGPVSTGLGEVVHYNLALRDVDLSTADPKLVEEKLTYLRTVHDWQIRPQLRTVPGVAEVNTWGGFERQYQVRIDPPRLLKFDLDFEQVCRAVEENNRNIGGGNIVRNDQMLLVQGVGRTNTLEEIGAIVISSREGVPIHVRDVADVQIGAEIRRGAVTAEGRGEVVLGLGFMLMGENTHKVTKAINAKLEEIKPTLPRDVELVTVYDRNELVDLVIETVRTNLFEGGLLVVAVLFLFLGNLRAALIVAVAIPLSLLCAFSGMLRFGISASLLSLGAIDFGMVVDSSVVMVENGMRHLAHGAPGKTRLDLIREAAVEVRKPTLFGELIIMIVYLPILTMEGIEGQLFRPMALTVIFALLGSMILSMTLMPVLASLLLPRRISEREPLLMRLAHAIHNPVLNVCMHHKWAVLGIAAGVLAVAFGMIAPHLGAEFVPRLSEGALVIGITRLAGTDLESSVRNNTQIEKAFLREFPDEIRHIWSRAGTAEVATDPMGVELTDICISLHPRSRWTKAATQAELIVEMQKVLRNIPGQRSGFSQPIEHRMNEMVTGSRADVAVKLFGDDFDQLTRSAAEIQRVLTQTRGSADVNASQITGQTVLQIKLRQPELGRHGISAKSVLDVVESLGSKPLGDVTEGQLLFPLVARLPEAWRTDPQKIGSLQIIAPSGDRVPLSRLADIDLVEGPSTISRDWGQRRIDISCNVRGRDMVSFVQDARTAVDQQVQLPGGRYHVTWGGQFEHYESARWRLFLVIPVAILLIFGLLFATYGNLVDSLRVFTGVPLGWVGGIFALWLRDMPFSISAAIGFIAMSGVAVLDDMILVSYIRQLRSRGLSRDEAVRLAAVTRLRPVLMTTLVAALGFLPMALSDGVGAEVQRPLATVVIGGVISAMIMSLLVIRVLYVIVDGAAEMARHVLTRWLGIPEEATHWIFGPRYQEGQVLEGAEPDVLQPAEPERVEISV
ncbi:MAG: efflux RND transporter permease subunit [Pirellulaceae bacterium]